MGHNAAPRPRPGPVSPATYWRRRVVVLALGIGLLGLSAWAVNGALGGPPPSGAALDASTTAASHPAGTSAGAHTGAHSTASHPPVADVAGQSRPPSSGQSAPSSGQSRPRGSGQPGRSPAPRPAVSPSPATSSGPRSPVPGGREPARCPGGDVVLSITSPRYWYNAGQLPRFTVHVVSTASRPCSFDVGSRSLSVVVSTGGPGRVWGSSDCAPGPASRLVTLARGVAVNVSVTWDRKTSVPGCRAARRTVSPGSFTVTAVSGHLHSEAKIFVLGAHGLAVP